MIAVLCSIIAIILYVWFRFEWQFAIGAVVALTHDVLITVGVFSLLQLTSLTTFVVLAALYILGGEVIRNFTFAMMFGVIIGTYSSIFIAAPLLAYLGVKRDWSGVTRGAPATAS